MSALRSLTGVKRTRYAQCELPLSNPAHIAHIAHIAHNWNSIENFRNSLSVSPVSGGGGELTGRSQFSGWKRILFHNEAWAIVSGDCERCEWVLAKSVFFSALAAGGPLRGAPHRALPREFSPPHLAQRFSRVSGTRHKVSVFKVREKRESFGLSLRPWRGLWRWRLAFSRWKWNFRK